MALYKSSLRMANDVTWAKRVKWSNTFFISAPNAPSAAAIIAGAWQSALRNAVRNTVFAYEAYATSVLEGDEDYSVVPIPAANSRGFLPVPAGAGQQYAPNICVAVSMRTLGGGRPSRKFWRPGLYEGDVDNGINVNADLVNAIETSFASFIENAGEFLVDPDGQEFEQIVIARLSNRKLGREASENLPAPPPVG